MRNHIQFQTPVLDYGSNDGHVVSRIFKNCADTEIYIADIQNNISPTFKNRPWTFLTINKETSRIESPQNFFGSATCIHVLEHVPNPDNVIQEIYRALQAGGTFYLETPNPRSLYMPSMSRKSTWNFYDDPTHIRPYSASALARLCEANGFVIKKAGIYRRWRYALALPLAPLISLVMRDWRPFHYAMIHAMGWSSYCLCKKPT